MFSLDGRRKPDVMAPGQNITSADDTHGCGTEVDSGTSFATPAVAGVAALVRQYYTGGLVPDRHAPAAPRLHARPARCSRRR